MEKGQPSLPRSRAFQLNSLSKFRFRLYERRASPPWRDLAIDYPKSRLGGLEIFHINALKRACPPTTKFVLASIFLDNFSFYKFCLFMCRL